jgi:hypothetical protein
LSGRYPIHLHHGMLGAGHFAETWSTTCYDPDYQAGYLKTPIFDGGSRPTELTLLIASFLHRPETDADSWSEAVRASKWGIVGSLLLIPILLAVAARGFGLRGPSLVLVATGSVCVTWSPVCRAMIDAGEIDLLLGGLCGVSLCGALADYHRNPGPRSWGVLALIIAGGWFFHPLIWLGFGPIAFAFYLGLAPRHGVAWHLGLWGSAVAGIIPNLVWLPDWCRYWWLRQPAADSLTQLPSPEELASTQGWSSVLTWEFAGWPMILVGFLGCAVMLKSKLRTPAWVLLTAIISSLLVAKFGLSWPGLAGSGVERVSTIAVVLALFPASVAAASLTERWKFGWLPPLAAAAMPLLCALDLPASRPVATAFSQNYELLPLGFSDDQEQFIQGVNRLTEPSARILIEERHEGSGADWNWTPRSGGRHGTSVLRTVPGPVERAPTG